MYRSTDPAHLLFLNRIRLKQPNRAQLKEYFDTRHWRKHSLPQAVKEGFRIGEGRGEVFTWLTCTNAGAAKVCLAALENLGISEDELSKGAVCDPQTKSGLKILSRRGIVLRLSRNLEYWCIQ